MSTDWSFGKVTLNLKGFRQLRTSPQAQAWVDRAGEAIAARATSLSGLPYRYDPGPGRNRARGIVTPDSTEAAIDSLRDLTLLRSMDAGRD